MSARAQRAAEVLRQKGWSIDGPHREQNCPQCRSTMPREANYCQQCGTPVPACDDSIADIEAAIAAALGEGAPQ
jgi:predicted amidophosphoribosyltransferase